MPGIRAGDLWLHCPDCSVGWRGEAESKCFACGRIGQEGSIDSYEIKRVQAVQGWRDFRYAGMGMTGQGSQ